MPVSGTPTTTTTRNTQIEPAITTTTARNNQIELPRHHDHYPHHPDEACMTT